MNTSRQIFQLRREKKYTEALLLAKEGLKEDPDDAFLKKACAWVLYDLCKIRIADQDREGLQELLEMYELVKQEDDEVLGEAFNRIKRQSNDQQMKIRALEQEGNVLEAFHLLRRELQAVPVGERRPYEEQLVWLIWKNLRALGENAGQATGIVQELFRAWQEVREFGRPDRAHSLVLQQLLKLPGLVKEEIPWRELLSRWDLQRDFTEVDWEPFITPDGKRLMPLAERVLYAYARSVLKAYPPATPEEHLAAFQKLEALDDRTRDFEWLPFFKGKLWLAAEEDPTVARDMLLPFLRKKQHDFWSWSLLAETFAGDQPEMEVACLCRAMVCKVAPRFLQRVRTRLAVALSNMEKYPEAAREVSRHIEIAGKQGWSVQQEVQDMAKSSWYQEYSTEDLGDPRAFYRAMSGPAQKLFQTGKQQWVSGVIERINQKQGWIFMRYGKEKTVKFPGRVFPKEAFTVGWCGEFLLTGSGRQQQVLKVKAGEIPKDNDFWQSFSGTFQLADEGGFGFVDDVFFPPGMVQKFGLEAGEKVEGWAVISFDRKKQKYGWRALLISRKNGIFMHKQG